MAFIRTPKHRKFGYEPRHYDPRKQEKTLEERIDFRRGGRFQGLIQEKMFAKPRATRKKRLKMMGFLIALLGTTVYMYKFGYSIIGLMLVLILLVLLIRENNKI